MQNRKDENESNESLIDEVEFRKLDENMVALLGSALERLPVLSKDTENLISLVHGGVDHSGKIENTLSYIFKMLEVDCMRKAAECMDWNGGFVSGIKESQSWSGVLEIWTKLFSSTEEGNICYDSVVLRKNENEYCIWDSHSSGD